MVFIASGCCDRISLLVLLLAVLDLVCCVGVS